MQQTTLIKYRKTYLIFSLNEILKSWDLLRDCIDERVWDRIFILYWFQICSVTSVIICTFKRNFVCIAEKCCVLEGIKIIILSGVVLDERKCVSWRDQGHFFGCVVSDLGLIAQWIPQWFLGRLDVALSFEWTSINLCVHSLYP